PLRLATFKFNDDEIYWPIIPNVYTKYNSERWRSEFKVSAAQIYQFGKTVEFSSLEFKHTYLGVLNHAPGWFNRVRSEYIVVFLPFSKDFNFSLVYTKDVSGDDSHFRKDLKLEELSSYIQWKKHFKLSGCEWAIKHINYYENNDALFRQKIMRENEIRMVERGITLNNIQWKSYK
ncbi:MAG: hypothetical protein V4732_11615, partial [Pseudomonadota bacterium]